jgi:hypothetical protein
MILIPLITLLFIIYLLVRFKKGVVLFYAIFPIISFFLALYPYWIQEFNSNFKNTIHIYEYFRDRNTINLDFFNKIERALINYNDLGVSGYFINLKFENLQVALMSIVSILGLVYFKGNRFLWSLLIGTSLIYLYLSSMVEGKYYMHYKTLVWFLPLIFMIIILQKIYIDFKEKKLYQGILNSFIIIPIFILSVSLNIISLRGMYSARFSNFRYFNTTDMITQLENLPDNSTLCAPDDRHIEYGYLNEVYVKKNLKFVKECEIGNLFIYNTKEPSFSSENLYFAYNELADWFEKSQVTKRKMIPNAIKVLEKDNFAVFQLSDLE